MSHPVGYPLGDRIRVEFVEADVEMGFALVDIAGEHTDSGDTSLASLVIDAAEGVFGDIERRIEGLGRREQGPFEPLMQELRRGIDLAKSHNRGSRPAGESSR